MFPCDLDHVVVNADRTDMRNGGITRIGAMGLVAEGADLAFCVGTFKSGEIDHRDRQIDCEGLARLLDTPCSKFCDSCFQPHLIDARKGP